MKAGFAGDEKPKCVFPSFVGRVKHTKVLAAGLDHEMYLSPTI